MADAPELARCAVCGELHPVATMVTAHRMAEDVPGDARRSAPERTDWWLSEAEVLHAGHPRSFFIPPAERRRALRPGELVKLGFAYGPHADREGAARRSRARRSPRGSRPGAAARWRSGRSCPAR